ncbi:RNA-directed DNA polymerase, eukaryota [Tanacetum coccineum]
MHKDLTLEINKDCTVADKLQFSVTSSLRRSVRGVVESSQLALLQTYIEGTLLSNMEDRWVWDLNVEGVFRVKDVRILLDECFLPKAPTATRWVKYVPIKINVFAWKVFLDRLPTRSNLQHRGVLVSDLLCPLCSSAQEDSSHLFFSCRLATDIVRLVCRWWNLSWTPLGSYADWLNWFNSIRLSSKVKDLLEGVLYITWWSVWMFRNQLLFSSKAPRKDVIFDDIVSRSFTWCLSRCYPSSTINRDLSNLDAPVVCQNMAGTLSYVATLQKARITVEAKDQLEFLAATGERIILVQVIPSSEQSNVVNHSETEITSDSNISSLILSAITIPDSEETLMLAEESHSKMHLKQQDPMMLEKKVNTTPVDYAALNQLSQDFEKRFVPQTELSTKQAFCMVIHEFEETYTTSVALTWLSKKEPRPQPLLRARGELKAQSQEKDTEKDLVIMALKEELRKLKGKSVVACRESVNKPKVIAPVVHKVELEPLSPKLKNNREAHVDYIRITKENADTLRDIHELLVYVSDTCPSSLSKSEKLVAVTPMNKARKVTYAKTSTTSDNNTQIQVDVHQTQTTSKPLVPYTNEKCSTNASRSKSQNETKNHRIMQPLSSNKKSQKIEAHTRNAKPSLTKEDNEYKSVCLTCNKCFFDARHDLCVVQYFSKVNDCARAKAIKSIKMKEWKPTSKLFKNVGYKWCITRASFVASVNITSGPAPQRKERFDTSAGNPVKEILLKLNLPDHSFGQESVDSTLEDMAAAMKQLDRSEEAIEVINSFRHLCSHES